VSDFDGKVIERLKRLEREVERLQVKERPDKTGWIPVSDTWTYASATTITVPSGATNIYSVGDKFKLTANSVVLQGYIVKVENTKLTVVGDALTNYTFSNISYSKTATPQGFPHWFSWTPTPSWAGGTAPTSLTINSARYSQVGKIVYFSVKFDVTVGSGTATVMYCNLPVANAGATGAVSASSNVLGGWAVNPCFLDGNITLVIGSGMTSDGSISISGFYEIV